MWKAEGGTARFTGKLAADFAAPGSTYFGDFRLRNSLFLGAVLTLSCIRRTTASNRSAAALRVESPHRDRVFGFAASGAARVRRSCGACVPAVPPALGVFRDPAFNDHGAAVARGRLRARDLHCMGLRRRESHGRLQRRLHHSRLAELPGGRRHGLDYVRFHLHPIPGGEARSGRQENLLHHYYGDERGAGNRHPCGRGIHAATDPLLV